MNLYGAFHCRQSRVLDNSLFLDALALTLEELGLLLDDAHHARFIDDVIAEKLNAIRMFCGTYPLRASWLL